MKEEITIIGAGHQGLAMAAHLSSEGVACNLWNRTEQHIRDILQTGQISCYGILEKETHVHQVSTDIRQVLTKHVMVTTPSTAHRDIAHMLAPLVDESYTIILNPGRTFGALDFYSCLREAGCTKMPVVAETQTIIYTCRRDVKNSVRLYAVKNGVAIATVQPQQMTRAIKAIPQCIRSCFTPVNSSLVTSMSNVGMVLHCIPVLMNTGWIEAEHTNFEYYYSGISPSIAALLERLDAERVSVASAMGCSVETVKTWLQRTYHTTGDDLYQNLQSNVYYRGIDAPKTIHHRYLEEDVPNGLVPLEDAGRILGIPTPITSAAISLASALMQVDYRKTGRKYGKLREFLEPLEPNEQTEAVPIQQKAETALGE